ncbi:hypothetical protein KIM372_06510 [Bombiscardovia nodaiensis]|uniref:Cell surface protein n=1 Tax=Bombiscardovia nodaiensis TaxID=2932181 RepID=A0ABM8B7B8_9BIFI|nr:hypothetical protein KIM372_06510 [Bombiscardovia nodaiensis]
MTRQPSRKPVARAPRVVRLALALIALLAVCVGLLALWNARATSTYNQASTSLTANLKAASQETVNLAKLTQSQLQVDTLFADAQRGKQLILPSTRRSIEHNAHLSQELTEALRKAATAQEQESAKTSQPQETPDQQGRGSNGLTQEQRQAIDDMLKRNQELQNANPLPSNQPSNKPGDHTAKPW